MSWITIKERIRAQYAHAIEKSPDELRLAFVDADGERITLVVREHPDGAVIIAQIARDTTTQRAAVRVAAASIGLPLTLFGGWVCMRWIVTDNVQRTLQSVARAALRLRRATTTARTDRGAFAVAL